MYKSVLANSVCGSWFRPHFGQENEARRVYGSNTRVFNFADFINEIMQKDA